MGSGVGYLYLILDIWPRWAHTHHMDTHTNHTTPPPDSDAPRWNAGDVTVQYPPTPLTVGALRRIIAGMDDHTSVVLADSDWFVNISEVYAPPLADASEDTHGFAQWQCLTLYAGFPFDSRQI